MSVEGEIKGRLTLDSDQFRAEVLAAKAKLDELTSKRTDINVTADTRAARSGLDATTRSLNSVAAAEARMKAAVQASDRATAVALLAQMRLKDVQEKRGRTALQVASAEEALRFATEKADNAAAKAIAAEQTLASAHREAASAAVTQAAAEETLGGALDRVSRRSDSGAGRIALLTSAIVALSPALFPVAGLAIAGAGALGGLGAAALLAGFGVARGLDNGGEAAKRWQPIVDGVIADVHKLQDVAAAGVLPGVEDTFDRLQVLMPKAQAATAEMADDLGRMLPTGLDALVTLAERGVPLWRSGADWIGRMVQGLDDFAHSDDYKGFIDYTVRNGPRVEQFLSHVVGLVGDIITAWGPYGEAVLPVLDDTIVLAGQIIKELGPIIPAAAGVYLAFRTWTGIRLVIDGITTGLKLMGAAATTAGAESAAAGGVAKAGGIAAAGGWTAALLAATQYVDYLVAGKNYDLLYGQTKGSPAEKRKIADQASRSSMTSPQSVGGGGIGAGFAFADEINDHGKSGSSAKEDAAAAERAAAAHRRAAAAATQNSVALAIAASKAEQDSVSARRAAQANDVLSGSFDLSTSAAAGNESSLLAAKDAAAQAAEQWRKSAKESRSHAVSLSTDTQAGRDNRRALLQSLEAINQHAAAMQTNGKSAGQATAYTWGAIAALKQQAVSAGASKGEVDKLVSSLTGLPKSVVAKIDARTVDALSKVKDVQARLAGLNGQTATVYINAVTQSKVPNNVSSALIASGRAYGGTAPGMAAGGTAEMLRAIAGAAGGRTANGTVIGNGSAATDTAGIFRLASGEEIISNLFGQAAANRPMLKAINTGDKAKIARTAQEQYGTGQAQDVRLHFTDDGSYVGGIARQAAEQAVAAYERAAKRTSKAGYMNKGLLAGVGQ